MEDSYFHQLYPKLHRSLLSIEGASLRYERQAKEQREPQVELGSQVERFQQVRPGRIGERLVKGRPKNTAKHREYDEIERGQRENETGEPWQSFEHFRGDFRQFAPMSRTAI